jgi:hypothetical protein
MLEPLLTDGPADKPLDQSGCGLTLALTRMQNLLMPKEGLPPDDSLP